MYESREYIRPYSQRITENIFGIFGANMPNIFGIFGAYMRNIFTPLFARVRIFSGAGLDVQWSGFIRLGIQWSGHVRRGFGGADDVAKRLIG